MGLICREALHARPLAVRLYTHSLLEMNFGSHKGDDNNCKASALPIRISFFLYPCGVFFPCKLSLVLSSLFLSCREGGNVFCSLATSSLLGHLALSLSLSTAYDVEEREMQHWPDEPFSHRCSLALLGVQKPISPTVLASLATGRLVFFGGFFFILVFFFFFSFLSVRPPKQSAVSVMQARFICWWSK